MKSIGQRATQSSNLAIVSLASLTFAACSLWPLQQVTSLSPAVQADTVGYNNATGNASDRILLTNVLRARDLAPLDLGQLSSISGTLSLQGALGFTLPWGNGMAMGKVNNAQNVATPSVMGSTTPTYTFTPLNTEAFTLSILQPVQASYVLTRWQAGVSRELLLMLFVKEIDFPSLSDDNKTVTGTQRYINDPDNPERLIAFQNLVGALLDAGAELKAIDILDPIGPPFSLYASVGQSLPTMLPGTTPIPSIPTSTPATMSDQNGFSLITGSNDGQYHVGNAPSDKVKDGGQLYRVYSGQVELCADSTKMKTAGYPIPKLAPDVVQKLEELKKGDEEKQKYVSEQTNALYSSSVYTSSVYSSMLAGAASGPGQPTSSGGGGTRGGGPSGQSPSAPSSGPAMTAALQAGRVSALVSSAGCAPDETVLNLFTEQNFQDASERFVHVQWRSVSEIFDYLGAVLRYQARARKPFNLVWTNKQDSTIRHDPVLHTIPLPKEQDSTLTPTPIFFAVYSDGSSNIRASYNGESVAPNKVEAMQPTADNTMSILSMLSTLVNYASQPGNISTSAPLRLLPIP